MFRNALFASLIALGAAGAAQAQAQAQAPDPGGRWPAGGNIVGGADATISGGGSDLTITYNTGGAGGGSALMAQAGRTARFVGTRGDGPQVEYSAPADTNPGREAWIVGGGDDAQVVYRNPH
jgi:hypothetical protein